LDNVSGRYRLMKFISVCVILHLEIISYYIINVKTRPLYLNGRYP